MDEFVLRQPPDPDQVITVTMPAGTGIPFKGPIRIPPWINIRGATAVEKKNSCHDCKLWSTCYLRSRFGDVLDAQGVAGNFIDTNAPIESPDCLLRLFETLASICQQFTPQEKDQNQVQEPKPKFPQESKPQFSVCPVCDGTGLYAYDGSCCVSCQGTGEP